MQITFVSNYINHHQTPVSDELYKLTGGSYTFIQTEPMEQERINMGWDTSAAKQPYVKLYYEDRAACDELIMKSDCVIFGGCEDESIIMPRLEAGLFTVRYSERIYREGRWRFISPKGLIKKYHDHVRFRKSPVYLLCSGAYVKGDFDLIRAYPGKKLKYGYFTEFKEYGDVHEARNNKTPEILWVARFIPLKHPELIVELARSLSNAGRDFHITMVGDGEILGDIRRMAERLGVSDRISFEGSKKPEEVREYMRRADIFIASSDYREGWGAVVTEAMNSGCLTIAPRDMGVTPYLIQDGVNGFSYKACNLKQLKNKVEAGMADRENARNMGINAYNTIKDLWNPHVAALRICEFASDPAHDMNKYQEGPLSRA